MKNAILISCSLGMLAVWLLACPQAVKTVVDVGGLVGCVLSHETDPVQQIVNVDCKDQFANVDGDGVQIAESILEQHRAAIARERASGQLPSCAKDGGP